MPTLSQLADHAARDVQNHYQQFLTGQTAPMVSPENAPAEEAPYGGLSHSEKDMSYRPGEAAPAPTGLNGETLAPEQAAGRWPSTFAKLAEHHVTDAAYTDVTGQQQLPGPQPSHGPQHDHGQQHEDSQQQTHTGFEQEL